MSNKDLLDNIKKLRELTGVGFKDCKTALDETKGDLEKSVEFLRKKGIAKASKKMSRTASEGLAIVKETKGEISLIEINSETDFVAKNKDFVDFCKELSEINFNVKSDLNKLNLTEMKNGEFFSYLKQYPKSILGCCKLEVHHMQSYTECGMLASKVKTTASLLCNFSDKICLKIVLFFCS